MATEMAVFALFCPYIPVIGTRWYTSVDFLAANHVRIVGLCGQAHRVVIFVIAQLSCSDMRADGQTDNRYIHHNT